ncbi:Uncharacterised protein [Mycobacteroides abscessus]|nr:Uncharacterised protein [Mycobacteroides abscessus]
MTPNYRRDGITQARLIERAPHSMRDTDIERCVRRVLGLHEPHTPLAGCELTALPRLHTGHGFDSLRRHATLGKPPAQ